MLRTTVTARSRAMRSTIRSTWAWPAGSRPSVGSSRNTTAGSPIRARAMPSRWRIPRLKWAIGEDARPASPTSARRSAAAAEAAARERP